MGKTPQIVAAEYALGNLDVERVPWYAAHWLAEGWDGSLLRELAGLDHTEPRHIGDLLPRVLAEIGVPIPSRGEAADAWLDRLVHRLFHGEVDERTLSEQASAFVSWNLDLDAIWRTPFTDLHVLVDEWDQGWGRGNQELATMVRQLCIEHQQR
jgi:hypothetical protein